MNQDIVTLVKACPTNIPKARTLVSETTIQQAIAQKLIFRHHGALLLRCYDAFKRLGIPQPTNPLEG
jgi:hypothetical protein